MQSDTNNPTGQGQVLDHVHIHNLLSEFYTVTSAQEVRHGLELLLQAAMNSDEFDSLTGVERSNMCHLVYTTTRFIESLETLVV